jgi:hypothetical protein
VQLLARFWNELASQAWEDLCRLRLPHLDERSPLGKIGPWGPASRWSSGNAPEWDLVSESIDGKRLLLGEVKWSDRPFGGKALDRARGELQAKPEHVLPSRYAGHEIVRWLFVPEMEREGEALDVVSCAVLLHR